MPPVVNRSNFSGALDVSALELFEKEIGAKLPDDYRAFLLEHNGGTPAPACFMAPDDPFEEDSQVSERGIVCFFALHFNQWNDKTMESSLEHPLQAAYKDFRNEQSRLEMIPIGKDRSGNYICIDYGQENRGAILFYNHEYEVASLLSFNFNDFLTSLRPRQSVN